jgi:hypothetical protein
LQKGRNPKTTNRGKTAAREKKQKKMKSKEFLEIYDKLWKEGPGTKYQNPERWGAEAEQNL